MSTFYQQFSCIGRSLHLSNKYSLNQGCTCLINEGRAITTHSFGLHICNKPKGVQTRRSIPNAKWKKYSVSPIPFLIFLLFSCLNLTSLAQEDDKSNLIKELTKLRDHYKKATSLYLSIEYKVFLNQSNTPAEIQTAELTEKGKDFKFVMGEQITIRHKNETLIINHEEKKIIYKKTINPSDFDPSSIKIDSLISLTDEYHFINNLPESLKGIRFKFGYNQYKQIDIIFHKNYNIKTIILYPRVSDEKEQYRLVITYKKQIFNPKIPPGFFNLNKYINVSDNQIIPTPQYKDYTLIY